MIYQHICKTTLHRWHAGRLRDVYVHVHAHANRDITMADIWGGSAPPYSYSGGCSPSLAPPPPPPPPLLPPLVHQLSFSFPPLTGMAAPKVACFGGLSPATVSQLIPIARLAYQGTLKDQLIFHGVPETIESLGMCHPLKN